MMKRYLVLALGCLMVLGCAKTGEQGPMGPQGLPGPTGPAGPGYAYVTLQPGPGDTKGKDNSIYATGSNIGTQPTIPLGYSVPSAYAGRVLMYFDISQAGLPAGATIVDAILSLYPDGGQDAGNIITCGIYPLLAEWTETASTWTAATTTTNWTTAGGDYAPKAKIGSFTVKVETTAPIAVHLDPTYVQNWFNGQFNYGFVIMSENEAPPNTQIGFVSRDYNTDPAKRPKLRIIYATTLGTMSAAEARAQYQAEMLR